MDLRLGPRGDVRPADSHDHLVVTARTPDEIGVLRKSIRGWLGTCVTSAVGGVHVHAVAVELLLTCPSQVARLVWGEEARRFATNRAAMREARPRLKAHLGEVTVGGADYARSTLTRLEGIDLLDDHQLANVSVLTHRDCIGVCLFDEQGAGKTVSVVFAWDVLAREDTVDQMLIVAPKSMVPEWVRDIQRFKGALYTVRTLVGPRKLKRASLSAGADVFVTNFETAVSLERELIGLLRGLDGRSLLVVDESFMVKNLDARRTQALRRIREWAGRAFVLCGTPAPNSPKDVVGQFDLADFGLTFGSRQLPNEPAEMHEAVKKILRTDALYLRHLKRDVLPNLPPKSFEIVNVDLARTQQSAYMAATESLIQDLRQSTDHVFRKNLASFMARRSALLQICSHPASVVEGYDETPAKLLALDDIVEELVGRQLEKIIIWSFYRASLEAIAARYHAWGIVRYDGTVRNISERREAVESFQSGDDVRIMVANPAAAGAGLTLHAARTAIYESMSNQSAHYLQSLDRIHRRGQERDVRYMILLCRGTIEEAEFERLQLKQRSASDLLGDDATEPMTREGMLRELLRSPTVL